MHPTLRRFANPTGIDPPKVRPGYQTYQSPYGPGYKTGLNFRGIDQRKLMRFGVMGAGFGAVALGFVLFMFAEVPKVSRDIMQPLPFIGDIFKKEVPPEDNPF